VTWVTSPRLAHFISRLCSSSGTGTASFGSMSGMPFSIRYSLRNRGLYSTPSPAK
jgi:hypothetical protein